jgi:hypothetical protein
MITPYVGGRTSRQVFAQVRAHHGAMTAAGQVPFDAVELLVTDAQLLVVDGEREIPGGWVAVTGGRVTAVGSPGSEPEAVRRSAPPDGLSRPHHHIHRNLTRSCAPAVNGSLFERLTWSSGTCTRSPSPVR